MEGVERQTMSDSDAKRLDQLPSATGTITRLAYGKSKEGGVDLSLLLKKAGLTLHQIEDSSARIRVRDQIKFLNLAAGALRDDLLGFRLAQLPDLRELGLLYYVASSSETLSVALQRAARYSSLINEGVAIKYVEGKDVTLSFQYVGVSRHQDRHQIEFFMAFLIRLCRQLTDRSVVPSRVSLMHRQNAFSSEIIAFFGCRVAFGEPVDEIAFAPPIKGRPVIDAEPFLNKLLIAYFDEALSRQAANRGSFQSRVENALVPLLPHGRPRISDIATGLGMSQRSLSRRLSLERLTFSGVLDGLRSDLAERYLAEEDMPISQIAWLLGYQEVSALTHAFKRWNGITPREARSQIAAADVK